MMNALRPTIGVLIRFSNSAATLPAVLSALARQTMQPNVILGIASNCQDDSRAILTAHQATVVEWHDPYAHSRVLNFGLRLLTTDYVLILSSHTVLESPDALEQMVTSLSDPSVACVSAKWDSDPYYSDSIDWNEMQLKGLRFGSIYSNSMGLIRRSLWETLPFDENLPTAEDYAWAVAQLTRGHRCARIITDFSYQRSGVSREEAFAKVVFAIAQQHQLRVQWLGVRASLKCLLSTRPSKLDPAIGQRLKVWWISKRHAHNTHSTRPSASPHELIKWAPR